MPAVGLVQISAGAVGGWVYFQSTGNELVRLFQPVDPLRKAAYFVKDSSLRRVSLKKIRDHDGGLHLFTRPSYDKTLCLAHGARQHV